MIKNFFHKLNPFKKPPASQQSLVSDFFLNASPEEQNRVFTKAAEMANAEQRALVERSSFGKK